MNKLFVRIFFISFLFFTSCDKPEKENVVAHSGYIYMACDFGPYYLYLDLLINNCSVGQELSDSLSLEDIGQENSCIYDGNEAIIGSLELHNIVFEREQITVNSEDYVISEIDLVLDGVQLKKGEYPYYHGFNIIFNNREVNIYMINKFIGGCFHDMILWEVFE